MFLLFPLYILAIELTVLRIFIAAVFVLYSQNNSATNGASQSTLTEESIVLSLAFGMVEEKFFTPHEISEMLNIPEENVKETISNGLTKYESMTSSKVKEASTELNKGRQKIKKKNP